MIYLDSGIIIRMLEGIDRARAEIEQRLLAIPAADRVLVTSRLACLECRCKPLREGTAFAPAGYNSLEYKLADLE